MNHCQTKTTNKIIMKIKHLLIGLFAVAATVACTQDQPAETPKLEVDKEAVSLAAEAAESSFNVTSNQAWVATADADWVNLDPASGEAAAEAVAVKVTAEDNTAKEARTAKVTVMAGELTKTVTVTQAAAGEEPEPEKPVVEEKTYILVGEAVGGWNVDENGVVLTLDGTTDGYYVAKAVEVTGQKGMHFTKNSSWEGNVKGKHGLIAPNEIGEVGGNDISLTESGTYDVYLTEALDKFYFMSDGKLPSEAVEHVDIAVVWGVCGAYGNNDWGNGDPDVVLAQEGEWYVAKNLEFTELNFKVRGNNSWADDLKWGCAAKGQTCELNKAIAVSTCTEYKVANPGENDNPNVYIGGAGTYDVYFSPDKKEVWVMTPGYKPGDATPEPDPVDVTYTLTGTVEGHYWDNNAAAGLMTLEGDYYVVKNISLLLDSTMQPDGTNPADYVKFKICETGTWNAYGVAAENADVKYAPNTEIPVVSGGSDIFIDGAGTYDVYFDKTNLKVWVMEAGAKPGENEPMGPQVVTVAEFLAAAEDDTVYELTGVITSVTNTTYGNFYLKDNTGEVYIYGLCSPEGVNKYWAESGAKVGDTITVQTLRTSYYGTPQGEDAIFVSLVPGEPEPEPEPEPGVLAEWLFSADAMTAYADSFGGTAGVLDKTAGDGGKYVAANKAGTGKISYVQVDKTEVDADGKAKRIVGGSGHPYVIGIWSGDYWLFEATAATECPAGTKVNISYITRTSATGHKYWRLEYLDGSEWKAAMTTEKKTVNEKEIEYNIAMNKDGSTNVEVDATVTLSSATKDVKFRMLAVGDVVKSSDESLVTKPNGGTCRIAGADGTSPVIKVVE